MNREINCIDLIEIFLNYSIPDIKLEKETPNINFIFGQDGFNLFKKIINDGENRPHHSNKTDLDFLIEHSNDNCLSIQIDDAEHFFKHLTTITNETIKLFDEYGDRINPRETTRYLLRRIWLRMGISDIENIDSFLEKQLQFVKNRTFDSIESKNIGTFDGYNVLMKTKLNDLWDETTRSMVFTIENCGDEYELPYVLYDIDDDNNCYIYGVQNKGINKSKKIERKLYKLNKGINNPSVHPSKICALLLFVGQLKAKGISKIIVPSMQVLSYHYHELLSAEAKKNYEDIKKQYIQHPNDDYIKHRYDYLKNWYDHVYKKQDIISYLKTEELMNLMYRLTEHDTSIEITNDVNIQGDSLNIKL